MPILKSQVRLKSWLDHLVGGFNPSEKYESQIGSSSLLGKIKVMFQTTNQSWFMVDINYRLYTIRSLIYHKFTLW